MSLPIDQLVAVAVARNFVTGRGKGELLYHALENVVRNALKYSPPGSEVVIRAQCPDAAGQLRIEVLDQGPGVPEAELGKIFGAFYRGSINTGATGNGLGLAIAQQAIQAHGGRIRAANRPEGGLCVAITGPGSAHRGPLAVAVGLATLGLRGSQIDMLLLSRLSAQPPQNPFPTWGLIAETWLWLALIGVGLVVGRWVDG